jgi:hypothetical protein
MRWSDIPFRPTSATLRWFAVFASAFLVGIGCWQVLVRENLLAGWILIGAAILVGAVGLAWPMVLRPIFVGWMVLVYPLNWFISHLILAVVYYCIFTPVAIFFKMIRRDALCLRFRSDQESYWIDKRGGEGLRSYFRQS